jgi:histidine phosphotransfer protein HptB
VEITEMAHLSLSDRVICHVRERYQLSVEKIATMLPTFITVLQNHMKSMEKVLEVGEPEGLGKEGHTMKGALLNLGLGDIAEIAETIETEGKAGNRNIDYVDLVAQLRAKLEEIL